MKIKNTHTQHTLRSINFNEELNAVVIRYMVPGNWSILPLEDFPDVTITHDFIASVNKALGGVE